MGSYYGSTTNAYKAEINGDGANSTCRLCHKFDEYVDYIVPVYSVLAEKECMIRYDRLFLVKRKCQIVAFCGGKRVFPS